MSPLDRLPENALARELQERTNDPLQLKGSDQSIGSGSVRTKRIFSGATYDFEFTAASTAGTLRVHQADIRFIPDDMTFGGSFCHRLAVRVMNTSNTTNTDATVWMERRVTSDGTQRWSIYYVTFGYPTDSIRLKLFFFANGAGTFSANVIT